MNKKIIKNKVGQTIFQLSLNQTIKYDPQTDSYIIQTEVDTPVGAQTHTSIIGSDILDQMYNMSWED